MSGKPYIGFNGKLNGTRKTEKSTSTTGIPKRKQIVH